MSGLPLLGVARTAARLVAALAVITFACSCSEKGSSAHHPGGDPDGRLLAALSPVVAAIPTGAHIAYVHRDEPMWESCDAIAGTFGWSDVVVQANFTSSRNEVAVFGYADKVVSNLGWTRESLGEPDGIGSVRSTWTKAIAPVGAVTLTLSNNSPDGAWVLITTASPPGHPAKGC